MTVDVHGGHYSAEPPFLIRDGVSLFGPIEVLADGAYLPLVAQSRVIDGSETDPADSGLSFAMTMHTRWTICAAAALVSAPFLAPPQVRAQGLGTAATTQSHPQAAIQARVKPAAGKVGKTPPPAPAPTPELPPRVPFTAAEDAVASIPGIPTARFWVDSDTDFNNALPPQPGPWLVLSSGGEDGAFGAGLLSGLAAAGKRPDYAVVTGVSTGALMAPFVFAGPHYDEALRREYNNVTAADIFEAGKTGESFVDSWPLRDLIAKEITPQLLADIATEYRKGRRLFVVSTDLDAERCVVWNLGEIAAHGGDAAIKLFRSVLLASASVPGGFPPVMIDVEANGKHFQEMHVDGGICGQFFVAPAALMASTSGYRLPATQLYIVVNTGLEYDFKVVERFAPSILTQAVGMAVKVDTRLMLDRAYILAKRSGVEFNVATIPVSFNAPSQGSFDPKYMGALFQTGYALGQSANPFGAEPPRGPAPPASHIQKTGEN